MEHDLNNQPASPSNLERSDSMPYFYFSGLSFVTSSATAKIDAALAKAQGEFAGAKKDSVNPHFRSAYADLASVVDACREALAKNLISYTQWPVDSDGLEKVTLITRLSHDGEFIQSQASIPLVKKDPQGFGSALTYLRRYSLMSALGIAPEDDDGNDASGKPAAPEKVKAAAANVKTKPYNDAPGSVKENQIVALTELAQKKRVLLVKYLPEGKQIKDLSEAQAKEIYEQLNKA